MSERFSYLCREPFGKAARQAVQVCTHARRDATVREPQTHRQSVFTPKTKSLSSAGYVAAFTQPWGSTLQRNARLGLMHGSPLRRDSPSMNDSNPRAAVLGEKRMSALQTDAYRRVPRQLRCQSKPSPAATDPPEVGLPWEAGYFNMALVCRNSPGAGTQPISATSSRKQYTAYTRLQADISAQVTWLAFLKLTSQTYQ